MDNFNKICMFNSKVIRKLRAPISFQRNFNTYRHNRIKKELKKYFVNIDYKKDLPTKENNRIIWVFWAQGYNAMPELVSNCIKTIKKNKGDAKFIFLTSENFDEYAMLPESIINKFRNGMISPMYFSDALRFNLLRNYGGLWMDATDFVIDELPDKYFSSLCTVSGIPDNEHFFIAEGRWHTALFGGVKNHPLFQFMDNFFASYWDENDASADYFMTDYALEYAYRNNIGNFREYIDSNKKKLSPHFVDLQPHLNDKYNKIQWEKIKANTTVFKLTYKKNLEKGTGTFYDFLIENYVK